MAHSPYETSDTWDEAEDLELIESEDRLPWLEADEEEDEAGGFATSRLLMLGALSLLLVGALVAGAWFLLGSNSDEPIADGSLIEAPDEPYKTKPEDAGGKTFPGTGDTSYAVGEGQTREGKLADTPPAPEPQSEGEVAGPSLASTLNEGPRPAAPTGVAVQVGAFPTRTAANEAWGRLMRQTEALNGVRHRVVEAQVDIGTVYRLQAMPGDRTAANALCDRLKSDGLACFVK